MRAATTTFEKVRRRVVRHRKDMTSPLLGPGDRAVHEALIRDLCLLTYSVGDYVWALFGNTFGVQLGRVRVAEPLSFGGAPADWWAVEIYWPTRGCYAIATWRRVLRALSPAEIATLRNDGVIPR
jgi:hypothetical protein